MCLFVIVLLCSQKTSKAHFAMCLTCFVQLWRGSRLRDTDLITLHDLKNGLLWTLRRVRKFNCADYLHHTLLVRKVHHVIHTFCNVPIALRCFECSTYISTECRSVVARFRTQVCEGLCSNIVTCHCFTCSTVVQSNTCHDTTPIVYVVVKMYHLRIRWYRLRVTLPVWRLNISTTLKKYYRMWCNVTMCHVTLCDNRHNHIIMHVAQ